MRGRSESGGLGGGEEGWVGGGTEGSRREGGAVRTEYAGRYYYKGDPLGKPKYLAHLCVQGP